MSKLNVVIVADIFGVSAEFEELCQEISLTGARSKTINYYAIGPYKVQPDSFSSEKHAYQYFSEKVGLAAYSQQLLTRIEAIAGPKLLIGFSVGGSAIWRLMPNLASRDILSAVCFYSSQIRHMTTILPTVPCQLIFPAAEENFSVANLILALQSKSQVQCQQNNYFHGALNKLSKNYDEQGTRRYIQLLQKLIVDA